MLLLWKAKHVGFCWSKIWMPFLMPSQQCPTHACVVVYSKRCVHDVGRVTCRQCIINCSIFSTAHWLTLSTEYTDSDGSRGVTSHLPGVAAYFMLLLFMWHKSYFDVVLCPSSSQILATNAQISFSCKPRPPQCLLAWVPKVAPSKNPRSANDRAGSMKRSGVRPSVWPIDWQQMWAVSRWQPTSEAEQRPDFPAGFNENYTRTNDSTADFQRKESLDYWSRFLITSQICLPNKWLSKANKKGAVSFCTELCLQMKKG